MGSGGTVRAARSERSRLVRRIPIRVKVAGALALPLGVLVVGAWLAVAENHDRARAISVQAELATDSIGHAGLVNALQSERNIAALEMVGLEGQVRLAVGSSDEARRETDAAFDSLRRRVDGADSELRDHYARALGTLDDLGDLRRQVDRGRRTADLEQREAAHDVFGRYSSMIAATFVSHDRFSLAVEATELRRGDDLVHYASHATDAVAHLAERLVHVATSTGGLDEPAEAAAIAEARRDVERSNGVLRTKAVGDYRPATERLLGDPRVVGLDELVDDVLAGRRPIDPAAVLATVPLGPDSAYDSYRDAVVDLLDDEASRLDAAAQSSRRRYAAGVTTVVAAAAAVAWLVSRSITRPLAELRRQARRVANDHLPRAVEAVRDAPAGREIAVPPPEAVVVRSTDEVGDVAEALTEVQISAIELAVEQAVLRRTVAESFVGLGRRNQNLLQRLLEAIGEVEDAEDDPVVLERLYRLDHLATRMRRNAESLLVLAGAEEVPRWDRPTPVSDVVRTALTEIEGDERVRLRRIEPVAVVGGIATDLAHMIAELIENALRHSPPTEHVEIGGKAVQGGCTLAVIDHGIGMEPDELAGANERLAGAQAFIASPSKQLGHYVTAVLAARHGITVRLSSSGAAGLTAGIHLPSHLLALPAASATDTPVAGKETTGATPVVDPAAARRLVTQLVGDTAPDRLEPLFAGTLGLTEEHRSTPSTAPHDPQTSSKGE